MAAVAPAPQQDWRTLEIDYDTLEARYKEEREKRITENGINQYQHVVETTSLMPLTDDPFVDSNFKRDPVTKKADVVLIGGGVGGLLMACRLVKAGFSNILIIEKGGDFGGVWLVSIILS
jgi:cyclohexanone monooxygenase